MKKEDWELIYITLIKLAETIWDWMHSWEWVRRHIIKQANNMKELTDILTLNN